jgi:hypothetical protein
VTLSCPTTRHGGTWGERRYSSYSYLTSALDGGEWSESRPGRALPPGKGPPVPIGYEAGWAPQPVWTQRLEHTVTYRIKCPVCAYNCRLWNIWLYCLLFSLIFQCINPWTVYLAYWHRTIRPMQRGWPHFHLLPLQNNRKFRWNPVFTMDMFCYVSENSVIIG